MLDLPCHVVPGIDDGPATLEDAIALCRAAAAAGTTALIATPHVSWDYPAVNAAVVHAGVAAVNAALGGQSIDVRVRAGAAFAISRVGDLSDAEVGVLRLGGGPYSLLECPHAGGAPSGVRESLRLFATRGHAIVLGHPERSKVFQSNPRMLESLVEGGALCCITARSLTGDFGLPSRAYAWDLLASGLVHAIASDAHDVAGRPPDLGPQLDQAGLSESEIDYVAREAPEAIIAGAPVPPPPHVAGPYAGRWPLRRRRVRPPL